MCVCVCVCVSVYVRVCVQVQVRVCACVHMVHIDKVVGIQVTLLRLEGEIIYFTGGNPQFVTVSKVVCMTCCHLLASAQGCRLLFTLTMLLYLPCSMKFECCFN